MDSQFYGRDFDFYNSRRFRRDFNFNKYRNRNYSREYVVLTSAYHGYQNYEAPKPRKKWIRKNGAPTTRSQSTKSASAFKPPHDLTITIPNFSGVQTPNLFRFHNASKSAELNPAPPLKSSKFGSAPAAQLPQTHSVILPSLVTEKKDAKDDALKSNQSGIDDVEYLYTVQTKGGEIVEVVDLSEDTDDTNNSNESRIPDHQPASNTGTGINDTNISKIPEKEKNSSPTKQSSGFERGKKRKKYFEDLHCDICESEYEFAKSRGEEIFRSRCGHLFCQSCLKKLIPYRCPECNLFLHKLLKVFL